MLRTQHYMPTLEAQWSEPVDCPSHYANLS